MRSIEHLGFFNDFLLAPNNERPHTPKRSRIPSPPRKPTAHSNHKNRPLTPTTKTNRSLRPQNQPITPTTKPHKTLCAFVRSNRTAKAMAKRSYFVPQTSSHPRTLWRARGVGSWVGQKNLVPSQNAHNPRYLRGLASAKLFSIMRGL